MDFLQSERSSSLFHGVGQTSFLFSAGEIASVLLAEGGWKMLEVKIRKVYESRVSLFLGAFLFVDFTLLCYSLRLYRSHSSVLLQACLLEVLSHDCLLGKLPHWINKSCCVHILTSYPSHGHGTPCFSFSLSTLCLLCFLWEICKGEGLTFNDIVVVPNHTTWGLQQIHLFVRNYDYNYVLDHPVIFWEVLWKILIRGIK